MTKKKGKQSRRDTWNKIRGLENYRFQLFLQKLKMKSTEVKDDGYNESKEG